MSEEKNPRRQFLQMLGLAAGATLVSTKAFSAFIDKDDILKLNDKQQEFMLRYGGWMDEFIAVIKKKKDEPNNQAHQILIGELSDKALTFKPELDEHMKDETFRMIYNASIQRMSKEIV